MRYFYLQMNNLHYIMQCVSLHDKLKLIITFLTVGLFRLKP